MPTLEPIKYGDFAAAEKKVTGAATPTSQPIDWDAILKGTTGIAKDGAVGFAKNVAHGIKPPTPEPTKYEWKNIGGFSIPTPIMEVAEKPPVKPPVQPPTEQPTKTSKAPLEQPIEPKIEPVEKKEKTIIEPKIEPVEKKEESPIRFPEKEKTIIEPPKSGYTLSANEAKTLTVLYPNVDMDAVNMTYNKEIDKKAESESVLADAKTFMEKYIIEQTRRAEKAKEEMKKWESPEYKETLNTLMTELKMPSFDKLLERQRLYEETNYKQTIEEIKNYGIKLASVKEKYAALDSQELADLKANKWGTKTRFAAVSARIKEHYAIQRAGLNSEVTFYNAMINALEGYANKAEKMINDYVADATFNYTTKINNLQSFITLNESMKKEIKPEYWNAIEKIYDELKSERDRKAKEEAEKFKLAIDDPYAGINPLTDTLEEARKKSISSGTARKKADQAFALTALQIETYKKNLEEKTPKTTITLDGVTYNLLNPESAKAFIDKYGVITYTSYAEAANINKWQVDSMIGHSGAAPLEYDQQRELDRINEEARAAGEELGRKALKGEIVRGSDEWVKAVNGIVIRLAEGSATRSSLIKNYLTTPNQYGIIYNISEGANKAESSKKKK